MPPNLQRMSLGMIRETEIERPRLRRQKLNQKLEISSGDFYGDGGLPKSHLCSGEEGGR